LVCVVVLAVTVDVVVDVLVADDIYNFCILKIKIF